MWAHQPWIGRFLTPGNAGWCNAVEGNTTFYAEPSATTIARWADQTPDDFRFAFKVPRTITHERRLRGDALQLLGSFLRTIEPLGERIGPVQLQLPPSFGPDQLPVLGAFLAALEAQQPRPVAWVVELRHPGFFDRGSAHGAVDAILTSVGVGRVVLDARPVYSVAPQTDAAVEERRTKPNLPVVTDLMGPCPVVRVIGADDPEATFVGLSTWIDQLVDWLAAGLEPYLFVHQPENLDSPALARRIHAAVAARVSGLRALPEPMPVAGAGEITGQSSLF
jgi:uncharacterized protein YecE (DUF72 family)